MPIRMYGYFSEHQFEATEQSAVTQLFKKINKPVWKSFQLMGCYGWIIYTCTRENEKHVQSSIQTLLINSGMRQSGIYLFRTGTSYVIIWTSKRLGFP